MAFGVSGIISYADVEQVVEAIVFTESRRYCSLLPGLDMDDIEQEVRLECIRVMGEYDPSRIGPYPYKFFQTCVRNKFYNMRRGVYVPNNPPCTRCHLWDKSRRTCMVEEVGCQKIVDYRKGMERRQAIQRPASMENDNAVHSQAGSDIDALVLDESIRATLPPELIPSYEKMLDGKSDEVPSRIKSSIRKHVKRMLDDG